MVLELFGVGPRVMQWEGATQDMLDQIPIIKYTKHAAQTTNTTSPASSSPAQQVPSTLSVSPPQPSEKCTSIIVAVTPPSIVISTEDAMEPGSDKHKAPPPSLVSESVVIDMEQQQQQEQQQQSNAMMERNNHSVFSSMSGSIPTTEEQVIQEDTITAMEQQPDPDEKALANRISTSCPICLCDYEDLEELRHLPCDHYFHKDCVDEWLKLKRTCPLCKHDVAQIRRSRRRWSRRGSQRQSGQNSNSSNADGGNNGRQQRRFSIRSRRTDSNLPHPMSHSYTKVSISDQDDGTHHHHHTTGPAGLSAATLRIRNDTDTIDDDDDDDDDDDGTTLVVSSTWTEVDVEEDELEIEGARRSREHQRGYPPHRPSTLSSSSSSRLQQRLRRMFGPFTSSTVSEYTLVAGTFSPPALTLPSSSSSASASASVPTTRTLRPLTLDGVFSNISAKPEVESPKDIEQRPPAYESAAQDETPPYFEMTVVAPIVYADDILVEGLPIGNVFHFLWNVTVSVSFQFLGVLITYLLHNSHASKAGSMVGLGITLLNFGLRMRGGLHSAFFSHDGYVSAPIGLNTGSAAEEITQVSKPPPTFMDDTGYTGDRDASYGSSADSTQMDWFETDMENHWVSLLLMIAGWMIIIKALADYATAKRTESIINSRPTEEREVSRISFDYFSSEHDV
ncbi:hypothetical protein BGZ65_012619 [Modicella reniformis]|uniref:RING-type domain-containing protein n=1 Tax=Modicella reniformis TaxID=1440133 RepID=A0A9P6SUN8_9FUNG|nr:hypothetical protein BGZ65_012619 [Modicella reniformis]